MTFKLIEDSNNKSVFTRTKKMPEGVKKGLRMGSYISGKQLVADVITNINKKPKSGRTYLIYRGIGGRLLKKPRQHTASSPSEYPAVITGDFRDSIDFKVRGTSRLEFGSGNRGLAKGYARALELGTKNMKARKPLTKTVKRLGNNVKANINKQINKQLGIK